MFGFLNVYKPKGMTSFDVIACLRKVTKIKRIGHAGTLDPNAQGVLPIAISNASRLLEYLNDDKEYLASVQFGMKTDSFDIEGKIIQYFDKKVSKAQIEKVLLAFNGEIEQKVPMYSAVHYEGKRLYELARSGKEIENIPKRNVKIYSIKLEDFNEKKQIAKIRIFCSKGTYIRSIADDLGSNLGCGGFLSDLIRTKSAGFILENAINLENIKSIDDVKNNLILPQLVLPYRQKILTDIEYDKVKNGQFLNDDSFNENEFVCLIFKEKFCAIALKNEKKLVIKKVLL